MDFVLFKDWSKNSLGLAFVIKLDLLWLAKLAFRMALCSCVGPFIYHLVTGDVGAIWILDYNVWLMSLSWAAACLHTLVFAHVSVMNFCLTNLGSSLRGFREHCIACRGLFLRPWFSLFSLLYCVLFAGIRGGMKWLILMKWKKMLCYSMNYVYSCPLSNWLFLIVESLVPFPSFMYLISTLISFF